MVSRQGLTMAGSGRRHRARRGAGLTRYLRALLFEISPTDPLTLGGVALVLLAVSLAASWLPARRAARVEPAVALAVGVTAAERATWRVRASWMRAT